MVGSPRRRARYLRVAVDARDLQKGAPELLRVFRRTPLGVLRTIPGPVLEALPGILCRLVTLSLLLSLFPHRMSASDPSLHPLGESVAAGTIQFTLHDAAVVDERVAIECVYRPYRERDVIKHRSLHLLGSAFRIGSGPVSTQRDEFHSVRQEVRPTNSTARFAVALRDPEADFSAYQLASIRILGQRVGSLEFERWFPKTPALPAGFGLNCTPEKLGGTVRPGGLGAHPLGGSLPLWPTLRAVELTYAPVDKPEIQLWDALAKKHWEGWRLTTPESWPGGSTVVARHIAGPTVWRGHDYFAFPPAGAPTVARPVPPVGVLPGVSLEVFWSKGDTLDFPEVILEGTVDMIALPVAKLTPRAREILALNTTLQPGLEPASISVADWELLNGLAVPSDAVPVATALKTNAEGKDVMQMKRGGKFTEPWLFLFGSGYDANRRYSLRALVLHPQPWTGPLPE